MRQKALSWGKGLNPDKPARERVDLSGFALAAILLPYQIVKLACLNFRINTV